MPNREARAYSAGAPGSDAVQECLGVSGGVGAGMVAFEDGDRGPSRASGGRISDVAGGRWRRRRRSVQTYPDGRKQATDAAEAIREALAGLGLSESVWGGVPNGHPLRQAVRPPGYFPRGRGREDGRGHADPAEPEPVE